MRKTNLSGNNIIPKSIAIDKNVLELHQQGQKNVMCAAKWLEMNTL